MIRILHSVSNMDRAGIETMLMNYYRHIDREKIQFDFLCNKRKPGAYDNEIKRLGGNIYHTPGLNPLRYPQYLKYMRRLFKKNPDYRVIEAHNGALGVYALYAAKVNHIPIRIFHAHGASITRDWKLPIKLICKALLPFNMNKYFTCGVAAAKCYFQKDIITSGNYEIIPNAIEVEKFIFDEEKRKEIRMQYKIEKKHIIGHVGRFMSQKNHIFLIDIFNEVTKIDKNAVLVLVGDGELQDEVKRKVDLYNLSEKVIFVGNVDNVNEWYSVFDVFVLPSIWEGLPVVGVEAQASDLPCVFSDTITKEIGLTSKITFLSLDLPIHEWAKAIVEKFNILERKDNTQRITENNYNIHFEAKKLQDRYLRFYGAEL